ncbi:MAG: glycogen synthase [Pseudomonadota bacterium]
MQILFLISEVEDIVKTGGLADVGKALPSALHKMGNDVAIILPYYQTVSLDYDLPDAITPQVLHVNGQSFSYRVKQLNLDGMDVYLIDHDYFRLSESPYADTSIANNAQKFCFFTLCAICAAHELGIKPNIIHANDWHTSMTSYFVKSDFLQRNDLIGEPEWFEKTATVLTIHNAAFQGVEGLDQISMLDSIDAGKVYNQNGYLNMLKTGVMCSDAVCPVSPTYAKELFTEMGSHGIHDVISQKGDAIVGILNGCDYAQWDPANDSTIPANFKSSDFSGKAICKAALQAKAGFSQDETSALFGMVCRATRQKGFDYLLPILEDILQHKIQLVIMGTGESRITSELTRFSALYPTKMHFINDFSNELSHLIEAGSDFFLMPSEFEPCGLNQMYSLAYATLPIVRRVGGLADTVTDINKPNGNGFVFEEPNSVALANCIRRALLLFEQDAARLNEIKHRAMKVKYTWDAAAQGYLNVYRNLVI